MKKRKARRRILLEEPVHDFSGSDGFGYQVPPDYDSVFIYFNQKGYSKIAGNFYQHFDNLGWLTKTGSPIKNWKVLVVKLAQRKIRKHYMKTERERRLSFFEAVSKMYHCDTMDLALREKPRFSGFSKMYVCHTNESCPSFQSQSEDD